MKIYNMKIYILNYSRIFRQKIINWGACQWKANVINTTVSLKPYIYNLPYKGTNTFKHSGIHAPTEDFGQK